MKGDALDPKGLFEDAYKIEGIDASQCRSIFLDWALSLPNEQDTNAALKTLVGRYGPDNPNHPMTAVMNEGLQSMAQPRRRGGWRSRPRN